MRRSPSTSRESFENACTLSRLNALATTLSRRLRILLADLGTQLRHQLLDLEAGVPDLEVAHPGELRHPRAVRGNGLEHDALLLRDREAAVARGDQHADREALDVPLPRARQRLVEVVDVEDEPSLGRRVEAEVREVRVAAALHDEAGPRSGGEVGRHDQRRAADRT